MCGILVQYFYDKNQKGDREIFERALKCLERRGPDDKGIYCNSGIFLGMTRLSIIDVATGHQPISNEDDSIHVVGNGEIYNFRDIRQSLINAGHKFKTKSDIETALHLFEEADQNLEFAEKLNGMFSLAIYDRESHSLVVARDRVGIKPLYVYKTKEFVAYSSEIKPLIVLADRSLSPDLKCAEEFFSIGYLLGSQSGYEKIERVLPNRVISHRGNDTKELRIWDPQRKQHEYTDPMGFLKKAMPQIVSDQLVSDVGAGLFLSGGIDSTILASVISRDLGIKLDAFTIKFSVANYDESILASELAKEFGFNHHVWELPSLSPDLLQEVSSAFTEPHADLSNIPTFFLSKMSAPISKVVLAGDGGDELFSGYPTHFLTAKHKWLKVLRYLPLKSVNILPSGSGYLTAVQKLKALAAAEYSDPMLMHFSFKRLGSAPLLKSTNHKYGSFLATHADEFFLEGSNLQKAGFYDFKSFLPDCVLQKTDRCTMFHGQESRVPFLDNRLLDWAIHLPNEYRGSLFHTKELLRNFLQSNYRIPGIILKKPKQGFSPPMGTWIRNELRHEFVVNLPRRLDGTGLFDLVLYNKLLKEHLSGKDDHARSLWALYVGANWIEGKLL